MSVVTVKEVPEDEIKSLITKCKELISLPDGKIIKLIHKLNGIEVSKIRNKDEIKKISNEIGIDSSILLNSFPALLSIYVSALKNGISFDKLVDESSSDILNENEIIKLKNLHNDIKPFLSELWDDLESHIIPNLPIDEFEGMVTRIINVAQFAREFGLKDDIEQYDAILKRYHARALITFAVGEDSKKFTFYADEQAIDNMIKWLTFTKKQLKAVMLDNIK